jgi:hypothetical protein
MGATRVGGVVNRWFGNRVPAGWPEGTTAQQTTRREPRTVAGAMDLEGAEGVLRARRGEPARRGATLERPLVAHDPAHQEPGDTAAWGCSIADEVVIVVMDAVDGTCRSKRPRSNCSSANDRATTSGRAPTRYRPGGGGAADSSARSRRRSRLRTTAGPRARPSANATRGGVRVGSATNVHHRSPARIRRPSALKRRNDRRSRTRQIKPTAEPGPCRAGT